MSGCTFINNTATKDGGAILNSGQTVIAKYNWWGSNNGPADGQIYGPVIYRPWLSTNTILTVNNVTGVNGQHVFITATLKDSNNSPIIGWIIKFNINGKDYDGTTTNNDGISTCDYLIDLASGLYPIKVSFTDDQKIFANSTSYGNLTVNLKNTILTVNNVTGVNGDHVTIIAKLTDSNGNSISGQKITFSIGTATYTAITGADGTATWNYPIELASNIYPIDVKFLGNTEYANSTGTGKLTVNPAANLYMLTTTSNKNPVAGQSFILTYKLGNYGPNAANNVTVTFRLPEGLEYANLRVDSGNCSYNKATRTITWTMNSVPIGDPYLYLTVKATSDGTYIIKPDITSTTYNMNTGNKGNITINVKPNNNNNHKNNNNTNGNNTNTVNAATQTITMQHTGMPIAGLVLAILAIFSGMLPRRKQ